MPFRDVDLRRSIPWALALLIALLVGCSGGSDPTSPTPRPVITMRLADSSPPNVTLRVGNCGGNPPTCTNALTQTVTITSDQNVNQAAVRIRHLDAQGRECLHAELRTSPPNQPVRPNQPLDFSTTELLFTLDSASRPVCDLPFTTTQQLVTLTGGSLAAERNFVWGWTWVR